jgi:hypothetical protein
MKFTLKKSNQTITNEEKTDTDLCNAAATPAE